MAKRNNTRAPAATTTDPIRIEFINAFNAFRDKAHGLFVPQEEDRMLDQLLVFRDKVFALLNSERFSAELSGSLVPSPNYPDHPDKEVIRILIEEMHAFTRAVEVYAATTKPEEKKPFWKRLVGFAGTTGGSIKDVLGDNPIVKGGLTVFGELCDLFKG